MDEHGWSHFMEPDSETQPRKKKFCQNKQHRKGSGRSPKLALSRDRSLALGQKRRLAHERAPKAIAGTRGVGAVLHDGRRSGQVAIGAGKSRFQASSSFWFHPGALGQRADLLFSPMSFSPGLNRRAKQCSISELESGATIDRQVNTS